MKRLLRRLIFSITTKLIPELSVLGNKNINWWFIESNITNSKYSEKVRLYSPYHINVCEIGDYTYIAPNAFMSFVTIGKFCSIGPNLVCGWGIHPTNGISTSPMFYSTMKQNGVSLSKVDKVEERKHITIGNDVFIGANVTILDGVRIGDGAIIGAGAIVSKDIPPYAIAVGCPIQIVKYRFSEEIIKQLLKIQWWNFENEKLIEIEKYFFDIEEFLKLNRCPN
jgi:acetyltransferase-like isoleucine patch superfamily enzyme